MSKQSDRLKDENPYNHIRQKTNEEWILYWICEDPEFRQLLDTYLEICGSIGRENHKAKEIRLKLVRTFGLTENEWTAIQTGLHSQGSFDFPFKYLSHDNDGGLIIKIPANIKRTDYLAAWDEIKELISPPITETPFGKVVSSKTGSQRRNRAADDTLLIYSVFKARRQGLKFGEIFSLYQSGGLPCYTNMPTNQFSSEDSLERYYNKYKPDR